MLKLNHSRPCLCLILNDLILPLSHINGTTHGNLIKTQFGVSFSVEPGKISTPWQAMHALNQHIIMAILPMLHTIEPGENDMVEIIPPGFPSSLSNYDKDPDGNVGDTDTVMVFFCFFDFVAK
jgi:hypothetical protein